MLKVLSRYRRALQQKDRKGSVVRRQRPEVIYPDDTFLVSYPRAGNAWLRRLIATMMNPGIDLIDEDINDYVPDIHMAGEELASFPRPRFMKSHKPYQPAYPRVVYLVRDGRDTAVSYYNFQRTVRGYEGSFAEFLGELLDGQRLPFGSWQAHVCSWAFRKHSNTFICIRYEDLHRQTVTALGEVAYALELAVNDADVEMAVEKCTFERQRQHVRKHSPYYSQGYRGGVRGGPGAWKETFDENLLELFWGQAGEVMTRLGYEISGEA